MDFLQKNMFYVALVAAVVTALVLALLLTPTPSLEAKAALNSRIETLLRAVPINKETQKAEKERNDKMREQVDGARALCIERNMKDITIVEYPNSATESTPAIKVFPFRREAYDKYLAYELTNQYRVILNSMVAKLHPTVAPTPEDLEKEKARQERLLKVSDTASPSGAPPGPSVPPHFGETRNPTATPGAAAGPDINTLALNAVRMQKASAGAIYIAEDALAICFPRAMQNVTPAELWEMQLNLIVHNEVLSAIGTTIDQVLQGSGTAVKKANVMNSPVKRLVKIEIDKNYVTGSSTPSAGSGAMPGAPTGGPAAPSFGPTMPMRTRMPPGMPGGTGMEMSGVRGGESAAAEMGFGASVSLGNRVCNKDFDVIRYNFQVVMPARYVPLLQRNLMERNFHTVLNTSMSAYPMKDSQYYFGSDPVMLVTINSQMLLMTAWERGLWEVDKSGKKVLKYPPLMPREVLSTLPKEALRDIDNERLSQTSDDFLTRPAK